MIDKILPGFAGIDIGAQHFFVAAAAAPEPVKRFGTFTSEIALLAAYLKDAKVTKVAMEATGVYWIPLHDHLQEQGFEVTVFNGAHARNLPGRKSDAQDCQWQAMLHSHGLLRACFIPPQDILELRAFHRLREDHLSMAVSHIFAHAACARSDECAPAQRHQPNPRSQRDASDAGHRRGRARPA